MSFQANAQQMNFKTRDLIEKLETNKAKHIVEYNEAFEGYIEKIGETLANSLKDCHNRKDYSKGFSINLQAPTSFEKEYNTIIGMLKFCTDDTIMLDRRSFQQYVMDEWDWTSSFNNVTGLYSSGKAAK